MRFRPLKMILWLVVTGCGTIDPGELSISHSSLVPDPGVFGKDIHSRLVSSCGQPNCHSRPTTLHLDVEADALPVSATVSSPGDLPEPLRSEYFVVLAFCVLELPDSSPLIRFGQGLEPEHAGGQALRAEDAAAVLAWLRSGGGSP